MTLKIFSIIYFSVIFIYFQICNWIFSRKSILTDGHDYIPDHTIWILFCKYVVINWRIIWRFPFYRHTILNYYRSASFKQVELKSVDIQCILYRDNFNSPMSSTYTDLLLGEWGGSDLPNGEFTPRSRGHTWYATALLAISKQVPWFNFF